MFYRVRVKQTSKNHENIIHNLPEIKSDKLLSLLIAFIYRSHLSKHHPPSEILVQYKSIELEMNM